MDAGLDLLNLNDLHLFVRAVDAGGFARAARLLRVPKSTISKRVAELEASLGARLIHRTSRSFVLTETGRDFHDHARAALIEAEAAEAAVRTRLAEPSGMVRITASMPVAQFYLAAAVPELARAFPKVELVLHVTDRFVDLVQENFDIAVRSHFAPLPDSGLLQRRLAVEPIFLVAAPDYLERHGIPLAPAELERHDGLLGSTSARTWRIVSAADDEAEVAPRPRLIADESSVLIEAAAAGLGIACLPEGICRAAVLEGRLRRVLDGWTAGSVATTLLMPHRRGQLPGVRAVVEFLAERFAGKRGAAGARSRIEGSPSS